MTPWAEVAALNAFCALCVAERYHGPGTPRVAGGFDTLDAWAQDYAQRPAPQEARTAPPQ